MSIRTIGVALVGLWVGVGSAGVAEAHLRDYLVNQSYHTAKRGELELEFHNDMNFPEADRDGSYNSAHQIELEYGLTNHVQLAYYEVYTWNRAKDWERDAFKIEAKARFAQAGDWPLDLALYTEYKNPDGHRRVNSDALENKIIISKDIGPWNFIVNAVFERTLNTHGHWEYEYTAGASYGLTPRTRVGLEVKQGLGDSKHVEFSGKEPLYVVPGLYTTLAPDVRLLVGPAFGMTRVSDDFQLKSIVEVEF